MDQQRWKKIKIIFNSALERPFDEREQFVRAASDGDPELESEVLRLLVADKNAGSYLELPFFFEKGPDLTLNYSSLIQVGDVLCNRFRIDRLIGTGGMGQVFEAWDNALRVRIALKTIRPEIAEHPASLTRFRQEVLTARSLSHPNICRTFDLERETRVVEQANGTTQEIVFLTMEFLEGETLAARIARTGALAKEEGCAIARQIASALTCAHDHGIVHGDIKPANIMLVSPRVAPPEPGQDSAEKFRTVITDFGLARIDPLFKAHEFSSSTSSILPGGTLAYMAPEQLEGAAISSATDIYSFGLILFEMATGERAFPSANLLAGIAQRMRNGGPLSPAQMSSLPVAWRDAIAGCLRAKADDRFKNAAETISTLEGTRSWFRAVRNSKFFLRRNIFHGRFAQISIAFGSLAIALALFAGALRLYQLRAVSQSAAVAPDTAIYLTQVQNRTGETPLDNVTELIRAGLIQSTQIKPLERDRVSDILQQMTKSPDAVIDQPIARDIAFRAGAVRVIFAELAKIKDDYVLNVDIQQPDNTPDRYRNHWTRQFTWHVSTTTHVSDTFPPELLTALREATNWIRHEVGESANDITRLDVPPADVTTDKPQSLDAYTRSEILSAHGRREDALVALQEAVHLDPRFALAYARMGDIAVSLGRTEEGYHAYAQALGTDFDRRLTRRELDRIRGIYASDSWDYQTAESAFHDYTVYYEHDYMGWFYRALPLRRLGRTPEAIATLQKAFILDPHLSFAPADLATCYMEMGDFDSAQHWIDVLKQLKDSDDAALLEGIAAFLNHRYDDASKQFASLQHSSAPVQLKAFSYLARLAAERRKYPESISWISKGVQEAEKQGNTTQKAAFLMDRAYVQCFSGQYAMCIQDAKQSISMDRSPQLLIWAGQLYGWAITHTAVGTAKVFRAALANLGQAVPTNRENTAYQVALQYIRTETELARGNGTAALKEARRTAVIDQQFARREYLAGALMLTAKNESDAHKKRVIMIEAREAYARTAFHPISIWAQPTLYPPGTFVMDLDAYMRLSLDLGINDEALRNSQKVYRFQTKN